MQLTVTKEEPEDDEVLQTERSIKSKGKLSFLQSQNASTGSLTARRRTSVKGSSRLRQTEKVTVNPKEEKKCKEDVFSMLKGSKKKPKLASRTNISVSKPNFDHLSPINHTRPSKLMKSSKKNPATTKSTRKSHSKKAHFQLATKSKPMYHPRHVHSSRHATKSQRAKSRTVRGQRKKKETPMELKARHISNIVKHNPLKYRIIAFTQHCASRKIQAAWSKFIDLQGE